MMTLEWLKELLIYDKDTGQFTWRITIGQRAYAGKIANKIQASTGYIFIGIKGKQYSAHRLAWLYTYGDWPKYNIDHIDGNRANNKISNLRDVPHFVNMQNKRHASKNNSTGYLGVRKTGKKFSAVIVVNKKPMYLGTFDDAKEAHQAYIEAKRKYHQGCTI